MARETEYGGEDTHRTQGIQPKQPEDALKVHEQTRLLAATDPAEKDSAPDRYDIPVYHKTVFGRWDE